MNYSNLSIKYLHNSSFIVETDRNIFIYDYYMDNDLIDAEILHSSKRIFIFCSHGHGDHYNKVIFNWRDVRPDITYLLSNDIKVDVEMKGIIFLGAYEELRIDDLVIKTYGSTDLGVSFLVFAEGISIFHAGDLNWWHWYDESDDDNKRAEKWFKEEITKIKSENIDIAFFPVDPRLREYYSLGADYFISEINPKIFIPMHFREEISITESFAEKYNNCSTRVYKISEEGEEMHIKL